MHGRDPTRLTRAMADLLDREAEALRSGAFDRIPRLVAEKERLAERLAAVPVASRPDGPGAERLREAAARNATLLQAAMEGLRSGIERVGALAAEPQGLQTYDGTGRRSALAPRKPVSERRA